MGLLLPVNAGDIPMSQVKFAINHHLEPIGKSWDNIDEHEQAKILFLILRNNQHGYLLQKFSHISEAHLSVAEVLCRALEINTSYG
jgi:hypothetical protein